MSRPFLMTMTDSKEDLRNKIKDIDYRSHLVDILGLNRLKALNLKNKIVIFTRIDDPEIDFIGKLLLENEIDYLRINAEQLLEFKFSLDYQNSNNSYIKRKEEIWKIEDIDALWFRHFSLDTVDFRGNKLDIKYQKEQWRQFLISLNYLDVFRISEFGVNYTKTKPFQLSVAKLVGFKIPKTIVTNDLDSVDLLSSKEVFAKAVYHHNVEVYPNVLQHVYGRQVYVNNLSNEEVVNSPTIFQDVLSNVGIEYRVTVFGDKIFTVKYDNVEMMDWHDQGIYGFGITEVEIPKSIIEMIKQMFFKLGLEVGTVDLLRSNNDWYFYEINTNGDWRWIESQTNQQISLGFIDYIKGKI